MLCFISCRRVPDVKASEMSSRLNSPEGAYFEIRRRTNTMSDCIFYTNFEEN